MWIRSGLAVLGMAVASAALAAPGWAPNAQAQPAQSVEAAQSAAPSSEQLSAAALEQLVGPIALYPDDLLSVVLAASTLPLQIVEAERFLEQHKTNPSLKPPSSWDPSVVALLNYPDVVAMMSKDLDWTQQLGNAVVVQQADVLNAVQAFRNKVYGAGNLKSNAQQTVKVENQTVIVESADPQTIYVPQYNPQVIVAPVAVGAPLPYYYSPPYPYYASPAATFATGAVFGAAIGFAIGWSSHGIYTGNWGWGGYYGGGNVNINRTNNININNTRLTNAQRTEFNNRVTQNRENTWHPDRNALARQQASLGAAHRGARVNPADIRAGLAHPSGSANRSQSLPGRQNPQHNPANRPSAPSSHAGARPAGRAPSGSAANHQRAGGAQNVSRGGNAAYRPPGGAFAGSQNGRAANRFADRGSQSLRSSNGFSGGGRSHGGGGGRGFRR